MLLTRPAWGWWRLTICLTNCRRFAAKRGTGATCGSSWLRLTTSAFPPRFAWRSVYIEITQENSDHNVIGSPIAGTRDIISGNRRGGNLFGSGSTDNLIQGNYIGTNLAGTADLGNVQDGVRITSGAANNTVGAGAARPRSQAALTAWPT